MGPAELHLITKSPLNFCCLLLRRISQPLLNEYSQMQISRSPVRPACHQLFLNAAALVLTTLSPRECLTETQRIERKLGRRKKSKDGKYHDRPIDIDLLLYDDWEINTPELTLPHPLMEQRDFVKLPLAEIRTEELKSSPTT